MNYPALLGFAFCLVFQPVTLLANPQIKISASDSSKIQHEDSIQSSNLNKLAELILTEAYQRLGIKMNVVYLPSERAIWSANKKFTDGVLFRAAGIENKFPQLHQVNVPLLTTKISAYSKGKRFKINGWESLNAYQIAYLRGLKAVEINTAQIKSQTFRVNSLAQAMKMLDAGRVDLVLAGNFNDSNESFAAFPDVTVLKPAIAEFPVYHYLHQQHLALVPKLEAVLTEMQTDNTINKIKAHFFQTPLADNKPIKTGEKQ